MKWLFVMSLSMVASGAWAQGFAPTRATSVRVVDADTPVFLAGRSGAPRRGTIAQGTVLPMLGRIRGTGCSTGIWVQVGPELFACSRNVELSVAPLSALAYPRMEPGRLLPYDYAFVAYDGARTFSHPQDFFTDDYYEALGAGFGVVVTGSEFFEGVRFATTRRRLYIPQQSLRSARGSDFAGVAIGEGEPLNIAWVVPRQASVKERPRGRSLRTLTRRTAVHVVQVERGWAELSEGGWVRERDLRRALLQPRPEEVEVDGTWIDLEVATQVLVAYRGDTPVYTTLVSSGRSGRHHATPLGTHRIWIKLAFSDMDNLQHEDLPQNYAIERVPWVQYFEGSNGLHAAFWHDEFGRRKSHGCINLSPTDARVLFDFTEPALPVGWTAIFPKEGERATFVHVR